MHNLSRILREAINPPQRVNQNKAVKVNFGHEFYFAYSIEPRSTFVYEIPLWQGRGEKNLDVVQTE